ncbi:PREDICTED: uncharacterized protein LOC106806844 [Priapulus caudatus]|uniref:Uncharacterized protein LOC106806844 n=1 Tax=Priapulus caudatus TaxID=37621 RepID=A0ABM1DWY5_PRICU|nr:PREDICTED: uncharacterized protein LOC106806844 [Priapulus caudatus]
MGDIEGMFNQVKVNEHHRDFLRFLWYPGGNLNQPPETYRMTTHPFGAVSSPACAASALRQCATDSEGQVSREVVSTIRRSFYVDDVLKSLVDDDQGIDVRRGVTTAVKEKGGFRACQWISNSKPVNDSIPLSERSKKLELAIDSEELPTERALGIIWDTETDTFTFKIRLKVKAATRRGILSVISSVFDPLGLAGPFVLPARILLQRLCKQDIAWDDTISEKEMNEWSQWLVDIQKLE